MTNYYLGPWQFNAAMNAWGPPPWSNCGLDLRDNEGRINLGLFCTQQTVLDSSYLRVDQHEIARVDFVDFLTRIGLDSTGITGPLSLAEAIFHVLYIRSDDDLHNLISPTRDGKIVIDFCGLYSSHTVNLRDNPRLLDRLRRQFQSLKSADDGDHVHQKWLSVQCKKYGIPLAECSLITLDNTPPLPPQTTLSDTLTGGGNDVALNTGPWEYPSTMTYKYFTGGAGIGSAGGIRAAAAHTTSLSSDDMWSEFEWVTASLASSGPVVRAGDVTSTTLYDNYHTQRFGGQIYLSKMVNNSITNITNTSQTITIGDVDRVEIDGSTLKAYVNGTQKLSTTDTSLSGQLRTGFMFANSFNAAAAKNWSSEDILAFVIPKFVHHYRQQGIA